MRAHCYILFFILLISGFAQAQKVALVLSGGGAKGLAHVGVIKALEENEIPIDYIVGTSMGAIVGGFYAAGYSASQIEQIILSKGFQDWVNGIIGDNYNYFYSKEEDNAAWLSLNLAVDSSFNARLNSNLASDLSLNFALSELLAQPSQKANYNFDSLFIPFRAIASDIFTQNEVILKEGNLSQAIRASFTVPFFYRPIKLNDQYLFDGGVYNNFPVDVAKDEFDPDIIIGVNVASKRFSEYPYDEDEKLISQSLLFMLLDKTDPDAVGENGIYIEPGLGNYSALDFIYANNIIDSGYVAAIEKMPEIKKKVSRRENCEELNEKRLDYVLGMKPLLFNNIKFIGFRSSQRRYIRSLFNIKKQTLNIQDIKKGYYKLISEEYFRNIYPNIIYNEETQSYDFEIYGRPRSNLKVEIGGNVASRGISQIFLGLELTNFNRFLFNYGANFYTGRFYQSMQLRTRINLPILNQVYIEPEFVYNHWDYLNANDILFEGNDVSLIDQEDRRAAINIGLPVGVRNKLVITSGYFNNNDQFSNNEVLVSSDTLDRMNLEGFRHGISFSRSSLNRRQYASQGNLVKVALNYFTAQEEYLPGSTALLAESIIQKHEWLRLELKAAQYFRIGKYKPGYYLQGMLSNQPFFSNYKATLINSPGFYPLQDSKTLFLPNFRAFNYIAAGMRNVYSISRNFDLRLEGYVFKPLRQIRETETQMPRFEDNFSKMYFAGTAGAVFHSPVGPISLSFNYYDDPRHKWGILLHFGYLIFNKRSLE